MTLDTRFYVLDEVDPAEIFRKGQELLAVYDEDKRGPDYQVSYNRRDSVYRDGQHIDDDPTAPWSMANRIGQGLPAILDISYRPGIPLRTAEDAGSHAAYEHCNHPDNGRWFDAAYDVCDRTEHDPACWLEISLDTAYGYKVDNMGCGDLHALLVAALAGWCTERNLRWKWRNEFTSEIHDDLESPVGLLSGGFEAQAWFQTTVMPAIASGLIGGPR